LLLKCVQLRSVMQWHYMYRSDVNVANRANCVP
jgi:hypothetical protein